MTRLLLAAYCCSIPLFSGCSAYESDLAYVVACRGLLASEDVARDWTIHHVSADLDERRTVDFKLHRHDTAEGSTELDFYCAFDQETTELVPSRTRRPYEAMQLMERVSFGDVRLPCGERNGEIPCAEAINLGLQRKSVN